MLFKFLPNFIIYAFFSFFNRLKAYILKIVSTIKKASTGWQDL